MHKFLPLLACILFSLRLSVSAFLSKVLRDVTIPKGASQLNQLPSQVSDSYQSKHNITNNNALNSSTYVPIDWPVPGTSLTVRFTAYGNVISETEMFAVLVDTYDDVLFELVRHKGDHLVDEENLSFGEGIAEIYIENLGPGQTNVLRWSHVASLSSAIARFSGAHGYTSAMFDILDRSLGGRSIGSGDIDQVARAAALKKTKNKANVGTS
ncbi:MAG: hypothetical protein Q9164_001199 [Protoblastenia rupestris]